MSERMGEPQVEDVLGKIRRLTSSSAPAPLERLVLTQAQRVHPGQAGAVTADRGGEAPPLSGVAHDRLAPIDEEVLQELIRELLTEELQGPLGEKITRNIRKMVRAEIGRALAERNLK